MRLKFWQKRDVPISSDKDKSEELRLEVANSLVEGAHERVIIRYDDGDSAQSRVVQVAEELYQLMESSLLFEGVYGDTIRATRLADGSLQFLGIAERSPLETQNWVISQATSEREDFRQFLDSVLEAGGMWEEAFGGWFWIHSPKAMTQLVKDRMAELPVRRGPIE